MEDEELPLFLPCDTTALTKLTTRKTLVGQLMSSLEDGMGVMDGVATREATVGIGC